MSQRPCPLNIGVTINAPDYFARLYTGNNPTHYPRGSTIIHSRGAEQLAPEYCDRKTGRIWDLIVSVPDHCLSFYLEMIMQPVFWAYRQETQV